VRKRFERAFPRSGIVDLRRDFTRSIAVIFQVPWIEFTMSRPSARCVGCNVVFDNKGLAYKKVCDACYRNKSRACAKCHVRVITAATPSFYAVCTQCYVDDLRQRGYTSCPTCPPEKATHLRRAPGKAVCPECEAAANNLPLSCNVHEEPPTPSGNPSLA